jgi:ring-1,2-phenylacetyl-CoA epoxidase subunit PaaD
VVRTEQLERLRKVVAAVPDPEIPVLSIADLGILRGLTVEDDESVIVTITPTYSGCPAMDAIGAGVLNALREEGIEKARIRTVLSPPWTTDWISDDGRRKLREYGIAPPARCAPPQLTQLSVCCPQCGSLETREVSRFGSTPCKAHYVCESCREPFDYFKAI